MAIDIINLQDRIEVPEDTIRRLLTHIIDRELGRDVDISVAVVTDERIAELNRTYLHHESATDVLSFPLADDDEREPAGAFGEIVVSADHAIREAALRDISAESELILYIVHGILHLVGYDDRLPEDTAKMRRREKEIMRTVYLNEGGD